MSSSIAATYAEFLASKQAHHGRYGRAIEPHEVSPLLYPFQHDLVRWSVRKGRAAIWADTGLGKTAMQCEWARLTGERTLIVAPLVVAEQTVREAAKFGMSIRYARHGDDVEAQGQITVTNYEMLDHFAPTDYGAVVLDESSRIKHFESKTRTRVIEMFAEVPYRLCCTATPAPNDIAELANHAEFLGIMTRVEMLATFFVHDDAGWRLKGHARQPFYRWLASWAMSLKKPSDLGYADDDFVLPPLTVVPHLVASDYVPEGRLVATKLHGITEQTRVRRQTMGTRIQAAAALIQGEQVPWIAWVGLNDEGRDLAALLGPDAVLVEGHHSPEQKRDALLGFLDGRYRVLVSKVSIAGFGLNLQHCARQVFVGLNYSFEMYYQAIRRSWRYGQREPVEAHVILADAEEEVYYTVLAKEKQAEEVSAELVRHAAQFQQEEIARGDLGTFAYATTEESGVGWRLLLGDSVERIAEVPDASIGLSVFSPPFASLYTYSATERDLGNSRTPEEFWTHFAYLIPQLVRVMLPGRIVCVHVQQVPSMLVRDGVIGLKDFRGDTIRAFVAGGFIYHGEVCCDKDPQAQAIRTKSKALLFTQMHKDSSWSRPALADYILLFRTPGENVVPIVPDVSNDEWIQYAHPVWYGIRESDTLNVAEGRSEEDERHIAPLQLGTIERCVRMWSNPGETVLSPFAGIGSEVYQAVKSGRQGIGIELKPQYFAAAVKNLRRFEAQMAQPTLFDGLTDAG